MKEKNVHTVSIKGTIHKACTLVSEQVSKATNQGHPKVTN